MSATSFNTHNDTWRKVMANGLTYRVPRFQRDYSWNREEWDDLWQDILATVTPGGESAHYLGYLVLRTSDDRNFEIIDGQQRLTTLNILVLAALRLLQDQIDAGTDVAATQERLDGLRRTHIGDVDPVTLVARTKLTLNRNNDHYYQTYLVPLTKHLPKRGFKASEHRLRKAFEWYSATLTKYIEGQHNPGQALARLIDTLSDRLFFTVIPVTDELNAYKVFETLNARGVRLSATDLLKNYLFALLDRAGQHERELASLEERWEQIVGRLGAESFPDFLRVHWISRRSLVRKTDLFKTIRREIRDAAGAFSLLRNMEEDVDGYLALTQPDVDRAQQSEEDRHHAAYLQMFRVRQPLALLLAARRRLDDRKYSTLLRAIVMLSFRYNVIGNLHTGDQERAYSAEAGRIEAREHDQVSEILEGLRSVYPEDSSFRASFASKEINVIEGRNHRVARYMLCALEKQEHGVSVDMDDGTISLEHICPTHPDEGWETFTDAEIVAQTSRLGNMTLLEKARNKALGNAAYEVKRTEYRESRYPSTRKIAADYEEWSPRMIERRQREMAKAATAIWRVSQLG